jgi:heme/copper-type cytochrome/quinol oxidase subunit 2
MTRGTRLALLGAAVAIAVVAFVIAKSGSNDDNDSSSKTAGATGTTAPAFTRIQVKNAKPVGGITKIKVSKGDRVRFSVTSDVADEIHVHGYDFMKDVPAGGTISFNFPATIAGSFVIELENHKQQIASLQVEP